MDRGRTFLAAGLALFLGWTLVGAELKLLSTPDRAGQALMLRPVSDAVSHEVFSVRARAVEPARRGALGRAEERRDAPLRRPGERTARDARSRGGARGRLLTGPEMALAGVFVIWGLIVIAERLRRWSARSR
jgi:hypothetical protein